ncbi:MAG: cytidylate kinase-like family protein, partial [Lachnospiraceae bacterium]|nr:cytidylate kinase-like family protein [Lachnospiraceae bacterium]
SIEEVMAEIQFDYLREKANKGESFVVVGRCGESVFNQHKGLISLFITGDYDAKLRRIMNKYELNEKEAAQKIARHDKNRKRYHNYHSDFKWGDSRYYDICINSSKLGEEETAKLLGEYIKKRINE